MKETERRAGGKRRVAKNARSSERPPASADVQPVQGNLEGLRPKRRKLKLPREWLLFGQPRRRDADQT